MPSIYSYCCRQWKVSSHCASELQKVIPEDWSLYLCLGYAYVMQKELTYTLNFLLQWKSTMPVYSFNACASKIHAVAATVVGTVPFWRSSLQRLRKLIHRGLFVLSKAVARIFPKCPRSTGLLCERVIDNYCGVCRQGAA